ncbi:MAG: hypothetical protein JWQ56_1249 [Pseudarthrobacter sp.]|nr:hypothetical protein [Pseudarthrobacter sp.]
MGPLRQGSLGELASPGGRWGLPGPVGASIAAASAAGIFHGRTDVGKVDGRCNDGREPEQSQRPEEAAAAAEHRDHAYEGGAAGECQPKSLGPLPRGFVRVCAVTGAVNYGPQFKSERHQGKKKEDCLFYRPNNRFTVHKPSLAVQRVQRLLQVGPEVLDIFDADTEAYQVFGNTGRFGGVPAAAFDEGFNPAQ